MGEINEPVICVVKRLEGYKFLPSCMIGYADGLKPQRD